MQNLTGLLLPSHLPQQEISSCSVHRHRTNHNTYAYFSLPTNLPMQAGPVGLAWMAVGVLPRPLLRRPPPHRARRRVQHLSGCPGHHATAALVVESQDGEEGEVWHLRHVQPGHLHHHHVVYPATVHLTIRPVREPDLGLYGDDCLDRDRALGLYHCGVPTCNEKADETLHPLACVYHIEWQLWQGYDHGIEFYPDA